MNYLSMEPVLFEKLHNIKLSTSVFRVTTFFQFDSTKSSLNILLNYTQDLEENLKKLYSKLITYNNYDHKSDNTNNNNKAVLYSDLLTGYTLSKPLYSKNSVSTLNSAYNKVTFNENLAIMKENLCTKYTYSINTSPLMKSCL